MKVEEMKDEHENEINDIMDEMNKLNYISDAKHKYRIKSGDKKFKSN